VRVSTYRGSSQKYSSTIQKKAMDDFVLKEGGETIAVFEEYKSGGDRKRKEIQKAIALAQEKDAILLVSALDRLARDMKFIYDVKDKVRFVVADNPKMGTMMLSILAGFAQTERELISERIKAGLEVAKSKGRNVGGRRWIDAPDKLITVTKERHAKKREELKEFALKHKKTIKVDVNISLSLLECAGYKNHAGNNYTELNLRQLGILEVLND
jgi:DNA invertase Pin-like site-specific DNA recombinase